MSTWRRLRLSFRDKDFEELRTKLAARKLTLTVAVSVANFINTSSHVGMTWQMQSDLRAMKAEVSAVLQRLETMQASESLPGKKWQPQKTQSSRFETGTPVFRNGICEL
ncbi:hypothetical protein HYQ46_006110 [Verticillium longisporum]|nr:hypothetical protein HYQ46_006110 [Verticillium longisporum]